MKVNVRGSTSTYPIKSLHMGALVHTPKAEQGEHGTHTHTDKTSPRQNYTEVWEVVVCEK